MRLFLIATMIAVAPVAAQAANCPTDMSALKPVLAYQMDDYALPALPADPAVLTAMVETKKITQETIEQDYQHKLTFKGIYAVNDAKDLEVKKEIDGLNKTIELERILRCKMGK